MPLILNIETSSESCSVCIARDGIVLASLQSTDSKSHATILTVLIEELLLNNSLTLGQLDSVAISKGPGSYTGLRIGVSVAKGICYGASKPLIAVNTLQSMMNGLKFEIQDYESIFPENAVFCPMLDARRQEVYLVNFSKNGNLLRQTTAEIIHEDIFNDILNDRQMIFFGNGADKIKSIINHSNAKFIEGFGLKAEYLSSLAEEAFQKRQFEDVAYFEPLYLKDFVATMPKRKVL